MSEAIRQARAESAGKAFRLAMFAGLLLTLAANVPGQMSFDSVVSLVEARTDVRQTWAPAVSSWVLKPFDHLVAGTGLYVAASSALLFFSLMSLTRVRPRATWAAVVLGVLVILTPQVLIYQGIVWRDVLFANLSIAGFILLAHAAQGWSTRPRALPLAGALLCLALAALARQNGLILAVAAAAVLAWTARAGGWRGSLAWGLGAFAAVVILALGLNHIAQPAQTPPALKTNLGMQILEHYDIVGAKAHHPKLKLKEIAKADPKAAAVIEERGPSFYDAARVDSLDSDTDVRRSLWHVPYPAMDAQWRRIIVHYPAAYVLQRLDVFRWTFLTPKLELCLPVQVGVSGPDAMLGDLDIQGGVSPRAQRLSDYAGRFYRTPIYSHLTWAVVAIGMIVLLLRRRDPADWAFVGLLGGTLLFAASFAVISVACDYRYLYLVDLAAMTSLLYVALDPPRWRRGQARPIADSRSK
ncbi:MAG TPA: hypothetical protein VFE18_18020 [Phenylobacterium sp.]|uniref:hypothetical protein n=1 Tax=Phenylobacterium sp. TaxID=1871053 RepID=UPI002D49F43B|nr:hypothetical protein [Phenylobacterium sp.]HZZ70073.1 hypothetical protein [Phenylobacterium sp.]